MAEEVKKSSKTTALQFIRTIYLSLAALIGLVVFVIGIVNGIRVTLNTVVFHVDDTTYYQPYGSSPCEQPLYVPAPNGKDQVTVTRTAQEIKDCEVKDAANQAKQADMSFKREIASSISMAVVGFPIWLFHWMFMQADWKKRNEDI